MNGVGEGAGERALRQSRHFQGFELQSFGSLPPLLAAPAGVVPGTSVITLYICTARDDEQPRWGGGMLVRHVHGVELFCTSFTCAAVLSHPSDKLADVLSDQGPDAALFDNATFSHPSLR